MSKKRFGETERNCYYTSLVFDNQTQEKLGTDKVVVLLNELYEENEQLKNELRKEKSLREYSDSMIDVDLIVNIRFSNGEWKADVSVIDDE